MLDKERQLDALLQAYREALPDLEPGADFTPGLWRKIEFRRRSTFRVAKFFVTAAVAASLLLGMFLVGPASQNSLVYSATYLDVLAADRGSDLLAYADVQPDGPGELSVQ